jgi:hypothetical protein
MQSRYSSKHQNRAFVRVKAMSRSILVHMRKFAPKMRTALAAKNPAIRE